MHPDKISIIVPIYNTRKYLPEALESIIKQTYENLEIILVNDGSTDGSEEICENYAKNDKRIALINQENKGASIARNKGLEIATGKYILFLDSDDVFSPYLVEKLYKKAIEKDTDITVCLENKFSNKTPLKKFQSTPEYIPLPEKNSIFSYKNYGKYILNFCILWPWDKLYKKEFLDRENIRWLETKVFKASQDLVFVGETLIKAQKITILDEYLINHRYHKESIEGTREYDCVFLAFDELYSKIKDEKIYPEIKQSFLNLILIHGMWHYLNLKKDKKKARKCAKETFEKYGILLYDKSYYYDQSAYYNCKNNFEEKPFSKQLFSIEDYYKRIVITILGIKIKIKRKNK